MAGQYEYIFRYYGFRPVIGGRVEHNVTRKFGTILKEGGSNLHYVRVQFDDYADPSYCHPTELDYLAPDEIEPVALPSVEAIEAVLLPFAGRPCEDALLSQMADALTTAFPAACRHYEASALLQQSRFAAAAHISSDVQPRQPAEQKAACEDEQAKPGNAQHPDPQRTKTSASCNHDGEVSRGIHFAASSSKGGEK